MQATFLERGPDRRLEETSRATLKNLFQKYEAENIVSIHQSVINAHLLALVSTFNPNKWKPLLCLIFPSLLISYHYIFCLFIGLVLHISQLHNLCQSIDHFRKLFHDSIVES